MLEATYALMKGIVFKPLAVVQLLLRLHWYPYLSHSWLSKTMPVKDHAERFQGHANIGFVFPTWTGHIEENQQDPIAGLLEPL
jgi:hypothetical protein